MNANQPDSSRNFEPLMETNVNAGKEEIRPYLQFIPEIASLKELNLKGIESLLPPKYVKRPR